MACLAKARNDSNTMLSGRNVTQNFLFVNRSYVCCSDFGCKGSGIEVACHPL